MVDYKKAGFKCGLEIHVQLDTGKLFCPCPSILRLDEPDYRVRRKLTAVAGELGKIDVAAKLEELKDKTFVYEGYNYDNCLVEIDEEPPHPVNELALTTALQIGLLLGMKPVDQFFVMRKTVVDGSNPSGFQRTALIAEDGFIRTEEGDVGITYLNLEEDAARKVKETDRTVHFRLDRLGIPLVELRTEPDVKNPEHARETAEKIGLITRMTGRVMRGIGTIRQDVNVSIREGSRVEIKGVQDLRLMPKVVENEVLRQLALVKIKKGLRGKRPVFNSKNLSALFKNSPSKLFAGREVYGMKLSNFKGLLGKEINPGRRLGTELSDYAKLYGGVRGIIHSDEFPGYGIEDVNFVNKKLGCGLKDGFVLVIGSAVIAEKSLRAVFERAVQCFEGVPNEVRNCLPDGTTSFMRPMPGEARLYPETDLKPFKLSKNYVDDVKSSLPKTPDKKLEYLIGLGLTRELAGQILRSRELFLFETLFDEFGNPKLVASSVLYGKDSLSLEDYKKVLSALKENVISNDGVSDVISRVLSGENVDKVLKEYESVTVSEISGIVKKAVKTHGSKGFSVVMGEVMKKLRGKVSGKELSELIKKELKNK